MSTTKSLLIGKWRLTELSAWDADYLDLVAPAFIEFGRQGDGEMRFGALEAALECSYAQTSLDFTWHGSDEGDEVANLRRRRASRRAHPLHQLDGR